MIGWTIRRLLRLIFIIPRLPFLGLGLLLGLIPRPRLLVLRLTGHVAELAATPSWKRLVPGQTEKLSLEEALRALAEARRDDSTQGVLVLLDAAGLTLVQAEELLEALDQVRQAQKKVAVWANGSPGPALMLSAGADRALTTPEGHVDFFGVRVRGVFLRDLLEQVGVVPQLDHEGAYKTASDMFTHRGMSPEHREMATDLAGDLYDQVLAPLVVRRELERAGLEALLDDAPVTTARAVEAGLFHGAAYRDQLEVEAGQLAGLGQEPRTCGASLLLARRRNRDRLYDVVADRPRLAIVPLSGAIAGGEEGRGCRSLAVVRVLEALEEDRRVQAVILRIDSPGGSATASEEMWRAIEQLDEKKPVVASLGRVAASGGYYAAVGARRIVAHAATLTGSIGIVSGKFHVAPALDRLGVRVEAVSFGARAGMYEPDRGFDEGEQEAHRRELLRFYRLFLERVAKGRGMEVDAVDALAQGRVYTGRRAHALGLVDRVGGLEAAVAEAREQAGLVRPHELVVRSPAKRGMLSLFQPDTGTRAPWRGAAALEDPVERLGWYLELAGEPALALCPWDLPGL